MKTKKLSIRKIIFVLISSLTGFTVFLFIVLLGELLSGSIIFTNNFRFEAIHFQIALLGGTLQGGFNLFKSFN